MIYSKSDNFYKSILITIKVINFERNLKGLDFITREKVRGIFYYYLKNGDILHISNLRFSQLQNEVDAVFASYIAYRGFPSSCSTKSKLH